MPLGHQGTRHYLTNVEQILWHHIASLNHSVLSRNGTGIVSAILSSASVAFSWTLYFMDLYDVQNIYYKNEQFPV